MDLIDANREVEMHRQQSIHRLRILHLFPGQRMVTSTYLQPKPPLQDNIRAGRHLNHINLSRFHVVSPAPRNADITSVVLELIQHPILLVMRVQGCPKSIVHPAATGMFLGCVAHAFSLLRGLGINSNLVRCYAGATDVSNCQPQVLLPIYT